MNVFHHRPLTGLVAQVVGLGLIAVALPVAPAIAATDSQDDFRRCASNLADLKLPAEEVVAACSRNLAPENLWKCVRRVSRDGYEPVDALNACRQVRQPQELASCVASIRDRVTDAVATEVLESCRRSLLPNRYSDCVVGLNRGSSGLAPSLALSSCNDELAFPREVDPTFIPYADGQPALQIPQTPVTPAPEVITPVPAPTPAPAPAAPVRGLY
ncbi:MAG: hypothetical protein NW224_12145 [Leptolyngbyaceae cyanobacterium bins.302]|nr:hypothetical protein [Leptolyngbyaceae cyanobacterium bins.302]